MSALKKIMVAIIVLISTGQVAFAAIGTSANYTLDLGDITAGGGSSSSANYAVPVSVIGDSFDGKAASANYRICAGLVEEISGDCLAPPPPPPTPEPDPTQEPEQTQEPDLTQESDTTQETQNPQDPTPTEENQSSSSNNNNTNGNIQSKPAINPTEETPTNSEEDPVQPSEQPIEELLPDEQNAEPAIPQNPEIAQEEPSQPIYNALENSSQAKEEMHLSAGDQSGNNQSVGFGGSVQIGRGFPLIRMTGIEQWLGKYLNTETNTKTQIATIPDNMDDTQSTTSIPVMVSITIILITALLPNIVRIIRF